MTIPHEQQVGTFFDQLTDDYTATIERCFPRYREMLWAVLDYIPDVFDPKRILELGCGTGNLSVLVAARFPNAEICCVDLAGESLEECGRRLGGADRVTLQQADFRELEYDSGEFDLIVSSIAVHHLDATGKQALFGKMNRWLSPQGMFVYADQHRGASDDVYRRHIDNWKELSLQAGSSEEEWAMWMQHQADHDHHDTLVDQLSWLQEAGFTSVDCVWRYLLWAVVQARR